MTTTVSANAVDDYLHRIGQIPTLSAGEEIALAKQIEVGLLAEARLAILPADDDVDVADLRLLASSGRGAYDRFMRGNLKLVVSVAKCYTGQGLVLVDLIQNGNLGLDRAVKQFDYTRGFRFSTCAVPWIRQAIWQGVADHGRTIRIPVHTLEAIHRIRRLERELTIELGCTPSTPELAGEAGMPLPELRRMVAAERRPLSLDLADTGTESFVPIAQQLVDDDSASTVEIVERMLTNDAIRDAVRALPRRERVVVLLRFGFAGRKPMTLERIGTLLGVSKQRIRQIEIGALERLRTEELAAYRNAA